MFGLILTVNGAFYLLLAICAPLIAGFYEEPRLIPLVRVLALQFLVMGFSVLPQSLLLREMKFRQVATVDFVSALAGSLATLALALAGYGVWALVWGSLMIRVVSMIGLNMAQTFLHMPRARMEGMWSFFSSRWNQSNLMFR